MLLRELLRLWVSLLLLLMLVLMLFLLLVALPLFLFLLLLLWLLGSDGVGEKRCNTRLRKIIFQTYTAPTVMVASGRHYRTAPGFSVADLMASEPSGVGVKEVGRRSGVATLHERTSSGSDFGSHT